MSRRKRRRRNESKLLMIGLVILVILVGVLLATKHYFVDNGAPEEGTEEESSTEEPTVMPPEDNEDQNDIVIVIDAGHGGEDVGKIATTGAFESNMNLVIAKAIQEELSQYDGVKVYLTRSDDSWMTNTGRAMVAAALDADFLISVHNNSGTETSSGALAYRTVNSLYSDESIELCTMILENISELGIPNGGVLVRASTEYENEDYYTLIAEGVRAGVPSVIIEHCFLSNPEEAAFVSNEDGTLKTENLIAMGKADAQAIVRYYELTKKTASADSASSVSLQCGYKIAVTAPDAGLGTVDWYSTDVGVVTIDEQGNATAVGAGTADVVYRTETGNTGFLRINVEKAQGIALVGGIDPTFYETEEAFRAIDLSSVFAYVIYSDGTSVKVHPEVTGTVDYSKVGIQDIEIRYDGLTGYVRICHNSASYVPEVTAPAEEE